MPGNMLHGILLAFFNYYRYICHNNLKTHYNYEKNFRIHGIFHHCLLFTQRIMPVHDPTM